MIEIRIQLAEGQDGQPHLLLTELINDARRYHRITRLIKLLCLKAVLQVKIGNRDEALRPLDEALTLGAAGGHCRIFVDEGPLIGELIQEILKRRMRLKTNDGEGAAPQYLIHVLNAFGKIAADIPYDTKTITALQARPDTLLMREVQILKLAGNG